MALASHAADRGEKKDGSNCRKRTGRRDSRSSYHPGQRTPRAATPTAANLAENKEHSAFLGVACGRPSDAVLCRNGGVGAKNDGNAPGCEEPTAAGTDGANAPGCGVPEADDYQDGEATASSAEEEQMAARIRAQMNVLMMGFFEIIRQVSTQCVFFLFLDRGRQGLDKSL